MRIALERADVPEQLMRITQRDWVEDPVDDPLDASTPRWVADRRAGKPAHRVVLTDERG